MSKKIICFLAAFLFIVSMFFISMKFFEAKKVKETEKNKTGSVAIDLKNKKSIEKESQKSEIKNNEKAGKSDKKVELSEEHNKEKISELEKLKAELVKTVKDLYPNVTLSLYMKNLDNGDSFVYYDKKKEKKMNSASLIKLFIMAVAYSDDSTGEKMLNDDLNRKIERMITESHNESSNQLIEAYVDEKEIYEENKIIPDNRINKKIKELGFENTFLFRKMHDKTPENGSSGLENWTSVEDVGKLYEQIYKGEFVSKEYSDKMLELLKKQQRRTKIPAKITEKYPDIIVANKTGELSRVENDAAIIMSKDFNLIFNIMINDIPTKVNGETDYELKQRVQVTISDMALMLVDFYNKK